MRTIAVLVAMGLVTASAVADPLPPDFAAARHGQYAAIVKVTRVDTYLRIPREYGETFYFQQITADVESSLTAGAPFGKTVTFSRPDYRIVDRGRMVMVGEEDLAFISPATAVEHQDLEADFVVEREDLLPLTDHALDYRHHRYAVAELEQALHTPVQAAHILDPVVRMDFVARTPSLAADDLVAALLPIVLDAEGQMKQVTGALKETGEPVDPWRLRTRALELLTAEKTPQIRAAAIEGLARSLPAADAWARAMKIVPAMNADPAHAVTLVGPARAQFETALALAHLGSDAARGILWQALQSQDFLVTVNPYQTNESSGRSGEEEQAHTAAARALGRLGDRRVLALTDADTFFAALRDWPVAQADEARKALAPWLSKTRGSGEPLQDPWYRSRAVLARFGDDAALEAIAAHWDESLILEPNLAAIDRARMARYVTSEPVAPHHPSRPPQTADERDHQIASALTGTDADLRRRALIACGRYRLERLHDVVVQAALSGTDADRRAAMNGLVLYARPLPPEVLRKLFTDADITVRGLALEIATAQEGPRYADEALAYAHAVVPGMQPQDLDAPGPRTLFIVLPRLLQGGIPPAWRQGLNDPDPRVRAMFARAAAFCAAPSLHELMAARAQDTDVDVRRAVAEYLRRVWPGAPTQTPDR